MATVLDAKKREIGKHSDLRKLRMEGNFPAIVYGNNVENSTIYVNNAEFIKTIREVGRNGVISLKYGGSKQNVILNDYQEDTLKNEIIHADFLAIDLSAEMDADVHVELTGDAAGVKDGGVLQQPMHEISVTAKPNDIPESIKVDISSLQVGEAVTIGDIRSDYSVAINHEDDQTIASILAPRQEEEISTGEQQESGVPENEEGRETEASEESEKE